MRAEILRQIWPVFVAETLEQVAAIGSEVLELERAPANAETLDRVRRIAHGLKGSAASLGLGDLEAIAHAIEEALAGVEPAAGIGREAVRAILDALEGIEQALSGTAAGGEPHVARRDALLDALLAARGSGPAGAAGASSIELLEQALEGLCAPLEPGARERIAEGAQDVAAALGATLAGAHAALARRVAAGFAALGGADDTGAARGAARIAEDLVGLRDALGPPGALPAAGEAGGPGADAAPRGEADERAVRVLASTLDSLARGVELLSVAESRRARRVREVADVERDVREAILAVHAAGQALVAAGLEPGRAELEVARVRLHALGGELRQLSRDARREAEQQRLAGAILREDLRALRMVPAALALEPLRRAVREVALRVGKDVGLHLTGGEVRLDRRLVDDLRGSLIHLVRNAVDHGIEPPAERRAAGKPEAGRIDVRVEPRGVRVAVIVEDDGRGLDLSALRAAAVRRGAVGADAAAALPDAEVARLAFSPGLSTAREVTTVSGRGVGLDAVAAAVARLRGAVDVETVAGKGARFVLDLPLTLAATAGVLIRLGAVVAVLPADAVERVLLLEDARGAAARGTVRFGQADLPFAALATVLGLEAPPPGARAVGLVLALGGRRAVVAVDEVLGEQEVVVGALGGIASRVAHLAGATLLDDGRVIGVLAPGEILRRLGPGAVLAPGAGAARRVAVVADDTAASRTVMAGRLSEAGFEVRPAADGAEALALLEAGRCDVLVSDVQMPGLDGLELARRVRRDPRWMALPIVLVSTLDGPEDVAAGTAAGADGYLGKRALGTDALVRLVERLLAGRGGR